MVLQWWAVDLGGRSLGTSPVSVWGRQNGPGAPQIFYTYLILSCSENGKICVAKDSFSQGFYLLTLPSGGFKPQDLSYLELHLTTWLHETHITEFVVCLFVCS